MLSKYRFLGLVVLALLSGLFSLTQGAVDLSLDELSQCLLSECKKPVNQIILWDIRFPRILVGFAAGASLAMAGTLLQNSLRNPLADPYLFGVVAGASLGATMSNLLIPGQTAITLPAAALIGALAAVMFVLAMSRFAYKTESLLLVGVAISFMLTAASQLLLYLAEPFAANRVVFWLMGSLARVELYQFWILLAVALPVLAFVLLLARQLDTLLLGEDSAHSLGVNVTLLRLLMLACAGALTAVVVAYCGGIGFVGLMIPHIARQWFGVTNAPLILGSALLGGAFLIWVDILARSVLPDQELPIGVITSALGGGFFLFVLLQQKQRGAL